MGKKDRNMTFAEWYNWVYKTPSAYKYSHTSRDQCLLLHSEKQKLFTLFVINDKTGVKTILRSHNTRAIYDYLLDNYCNKPDTDKGQQLKVNVYYSDHAVRCAMEKGIKSGDCYLSTPKALHNMSGRVVAETTMFRCINLRWTSYYFGYLVNDKEDLRNVVKDIQHRFNVCPQDNYKYGFTSRLKELFKVKTDIKGDFCLYDSEEGKDLQRMLAKYCNLGALMGAINKTELYNVYSYDIDSAYIYHIFSSCFPSNRFYRLNPAEYDYTTHKNGYTHFMQAYVTMSIKTEYAARVWFPMSAGNVFNDELLNKTIELTNTNKIMSCKNHILGLWEEDLEILKEFYDVQSFEPISVYQFELMPLTETLKNMVMNLYINKTSKKKSGENYHTEKILLNRGGYGLWVTKRYVELPHSANEGKKVIRVQSDPEVPFQIGAYIVALQRKLLLNMMQKIGMDHVVAFHTDSIKTDIDCERIFTEYNQGINIYEKMGHFELEWIADRVYFFNTVRYKADAIAKSKKTGEFERKIIVKHGGIDAKDMEGAAIFDMDYDDIKHDTEITITVPGTTWINADDAIKHKITTTTRFGHMEEWMKKTDDGDLLALQQ